MTSKSFLSNNAKTNTSANKKGRELHLKRLSFLSYKSQQALLFLTSQCHPTTNTSGTVFPYLNVSQFWIQSIQFSGLKAPQFELVSKILKSLPFLERATFDDALNVTDNDVAEICQGLKHPWINAKTMGSALHALTFTLKQSSSFHPLKLTTYAAVENLLQNLPYLEELHLSLPSFDLFLSLFLSGFESVVPLTKLNFSGFGLDAKNCHQLALLICRLIFIQQLDLSCNPIGDGLCLICKQLCHFRCLRVSIRSVNNRMCLLHVTRVCIKVKSN